jgi:hypothetical protein
VRNNFGKRLEKDKVDKNNVLKHIDDPKFKNILSINMIPSKLVMQLKNKVFNIELFSFPTKTQKL